MKATKTYLKSTILHLRGVRKATDRNIKSLDNIVTAIAQLSENNELNWSSDYIDLECYITHCQKHN